MKKFTVLLVSFAIWMWVMIPEAYPCTALCLKDDAGWVAGFNFDWYLEDAVVLVNKRGVKKTAFSNYAKLSETSMAQWTSKYGSVTINQYGCDVVASGMNEAGLFVAMLGLPEAEWSSPDSRLSVTTAQWVQYQLDNSGTVKDVIESDNVIRVHGGKGLVHFFACDKTGECATIEGIKGKTEIHHTPKNMPVKVLTNVPYAEALNSFQQGRITYNNYAQSITRFLQAAESLKEADRKPPKSATDFTFMTLKKVGFYEEIDGIKPFPATEWSAVYDFTNMLIHFRTYRDENIRSIRLGSLDFSCESPVQAFEIQSTLSGDVTHKFFNYNTEMNRALIMKSYKRTAELTEIPDAVLEKRSVYPESFRCTK